MDDDTLERFLPALGDRVALRHFCSNSNHVKQSRKLNLLDRLRKKMKLGNPSSFAEDSSEEEESHIRKRLWLEIKMLLKTQDGLSWDGYTTESKCGGGTRKLVVLKTAGYDDLIKLGMELFFPCRYVKKRS